MDGDRTKLKANMKTETKERVERRRKAHHAALETLAREVGCTTDGLTLWRKLRRIEREVYRACEAYSNDPDFGVERWESVKDKACGELREVFGGKLPVGLFVNGDPRGHMLKLDNDERAIPEGMQTDWGGNGILAVEINPED